MKKMKLQVLQGDTLKSITGGITNALSGKVAGVQIRSTGGGLNSSSRIIIRGNNS